jgi:hypothetical protein
VLTASRFIVLCCLIGAIGYGQTEPPANEPLEEFARRPAAHVVWSAETGKIDAEEAHAVVTALVVEDPTQVPGRMSGIRIDLIGADGNDKVYAAEDSLEKLVGALDEISTGSPRFLAGSTGSRNSRCFGSGMFWQQTGHRFSASQCVFAGWTGLTVHTGMQFRFRGLDPSPFKAAIARARDELKLH